MSSYASLLNNVNDNAWPVNLIAFDKTRVAPRTSYFIQKLFRDNRPDETLATTISPALAPDKAKIYALGGFDKQKGEVVLKIVTRDQESSIVHVNLNNLGVLKGTMDIVALANENAEAENTVDDQHLIEPRKSAATIRGTSIDYTLEPNSLTILRINTQCPIDRR